MGLKHGKSQLTVVAQEQKEKAEAFWKQVEVLTGVKKKAKDKSDALRVAKWKASQNGSLLGRMKAVQKKKHKLLKEKKAEDKYNLILKQMVKQMGDDTTGTKELEDMGKKLFGSQFIGTFPQDALPPAIFKKDKKKRYAIINVDTTGLPGSHWVAIAGLPNSKKIMIYDSFGRLTKNLLPIIKKQVKKSGSSYSDTDHDAEQKKMQKSCGQRSLAWLLFLDRYGPANARLI